MKIIKISGAVIGVILLLVSLGLAWIWMQTRVPSAIDEVTAPARGDTVLSAFYAPLQTLPQTLPEAPGALILQETIEGEAVLAQAAANWRILYSSTEGLGAAKINAVSGALFLPKGDVPEGGWPLLIWSHGTVGIGDVCAPSFAGRGERDRAYLGPWLEQGYAVAASDYQGLGTPGTHPYMDARTMAFNNLDLIRALQASDFPLSDQVLIAGQSQGATGALAAASYNDIYAPDVEIAGILATGVPHFSSGVIWDLATKSDPDEVSASVPLSLYMLAFAEMLDPDFKMEAILSDKALEVTERIGDTCVFDLIEASQKAGLTSNNSFESRPELPLIKVFSRTDLPTLRFKTPVFTGSGTADKITPFSMQQAFIAEACAAGANITAITYEEANHNEGLLQSIEDAQRFAATVLSNGSLKGTCPN